MVERIKVVDIELEDPPTSFEGLEHYSALRGLVRLHGVPLGYVDVPLSAGRCTALQIREVMLKQLEWPLLRQHLLHYLAVDTHSEADLITQILTAPAPDYTGPMPLVTVAVCTRDRPDDLKLCLDALRQLDYPHLDIVIVDNAPATEATANLVRTHYPEMRYVREPRPGLNWARNRAILTARGEIVAYTDDDVIVDAGWVRALARVFATNPGVMAVTGLVVPYELETESQIAFERYGGFGRGFEQKWYGVNDIGGERAATWHAGAGKFGTGANMAYRRSVFNEIGFFDPALDVGTVTNGGGDLEMFFRVLKEGHPLVYEPCAMVRHRHRRDYQRFRTQIANNGVGFYSYLVRSFLAYPDEQRPLLRLGLWWFWYWSLRRLLMSLIRPVGSSRDIILAELWGSLVGLRRYQQARRTAARLVQQDDPSFVPVTRHKRAATTCRPHGMAVRRVDLEQPLSSLLDVTDYPDVRIFVFRRDQPVGSVDIANRYQPVHVDRLREALVNTLHINLLDLNTDEPPSMHWSLFLTALRNHYMAAVRTTLPNTPHLPDTIPVSIIVGTYDRPDDLRSCLRCLVAQKTTRPVEIIVVDNHPASGLTAPVVAEFPGVMLVTESRAGVSYARNRGIGVSSSPIIVTTDDDVTMPNDWLEKLIAPLVRDDVMVVTGNILPIQLETRSQCLFEQYGGLGRGFGRIEVNGDWFRCFRRAVPTWHLGGTANAAFRATIFNHPQIGLMDEVLGPGTPTGVGEDTYLFYKVLKANYTIVYEPAAYVWHRHRQDMPALRRQLYNYSKGHVAYHLTTFLRDHDPRGLIRVVLELPQWHLQRVIHGLSAHLRGKPTYPLRLMALEIRGNLAGPSTLIRSWQRVRREGRSTPYVPPPTVPVQSILTLDHSQKVPDQQPLCVSNELITG